MRGGMRGEEEGMSIPSGHVFDTSSKEDAYGNQEPAFSRFHHK